MGTYTKIFINLGIVLIILSLFACKTSQQTVNSDKLDENRTVYWFYVKLREVNVNNTEIMAYKLHKLSSVSEKGTAKEYDYLLWKYLSEGSKFAVGPFNNKEEAKKAFLFYKIQTEAHRLDASYNKSQKIFWFVLNVNKRERSDSFELSRIPGAIASGTYADFDVFLKENLDLHIMTIGPFENMTDAEESKRVYRLH